MIDPEMTSSFFINKEKSRDLKLEDILSPSQLPSNKKIDVLAKAIHNIILSNGNDYDLTEEQKKLLTKSNNDVNESHFKKKIEDRLLEYKVPITQAHLLKKPTWIIDNTEGQKSRKLTKLGKRIQTMTHFIPSASMTKMRQTLETYPRKIPLWVLLC